MTRAAIALAVSGFAFVACANDFDALFTPSTTAPTADGGQIDPTTACGAPVADSACKSSSDPGDLELTNTCSGCGCDCPAYTCTTTSGACATNCSGGASCTASCADQDTCAFNADEASGNFTCTGKTACALDCKNGSSCALDCSKADSCNVTCDAQSQALVTCGSACTVDCGTGKQTKCANGVVTCNAACPTP